MAVPTLVEEANGGNTTASDNNIPLTFAATPSDGRLIILEYTQDSATPATRTWPSGFTEFLTITGGNGDIFAAWKIAASEASATYDIDLGDTGDTGQGLRGQIWSGVDGTTPINVVGSGSATGFKNNGDTFSAGTVTTTVDDCALVIVVADQSNDFDGITATGYTQMEHDGTPDITRRMQLLHGSKATAGATGAVTVTVAGGFINNASVVQFAIAPTGGGGGGTTPKGVFGKALDGPLRRVVYP